MDDFHNWRDWVFYVSMISMDGLSISAFCILVYISKKCDDDNLRKYCNLGYALDPRHFISWGVIFKMMRWFCVTGYRKSAIGVVLFLMFCVSVVCFVLSIISH